MALPTCPPAVRAIVPQSFTVATVPVSQPSGGRPWAVNSNADNNIEVSIITGANKWRFEPIAGTPFFELINNQFGVGVRRKLWADGVWVLTYSTTGTTGRVKFALTQPTNPRAMQQMEVYDYGSSITDLPVGRIGLGISGISGNSELRVVSPDEAAPYVVYTEDPFMGDSADERCLEFMVGRCHTNFDTICEQYVGSLPTEYASKIMGPYCTGANLERGECISYCNRQGVQCDANYRAYCANPDNYTKEVCGCFLPVGVYTNITAALAQRDPQFGTINQNTAPTCFYPPCAAAPIQTFPWRTGQSPACPNITACIQNVEIDANGNVTNVSVSTGGDCQIGPPDSPVSAPGGIPWWVWVVAALGVAIVLFVLTHRPRRNVSP